MLLNFFVNRKREQEQKTLFRNFIFGVEDSLVSTVGMLSGIAAADTPVDEIITAGIILIFVEAFSMGIGSFLSEDTSDMLSRKRSVSSLTIKKAAMIMFVSYFLAGLIPLSPYLLLPAHTAESISITLSLLSLFILGGFSATFFRGNILYKALEMFILGGLATLVGIGIGSLFKL